MNWTTPPFKTLKPTSDPRYRFVGTCLVDEEQYRVEGWQRSVDGWETADGSTAYYWRLSPKGCEEYARLRAQRRADRKTAWEEREQHEHAYTEWVNSMVDGGVAW